MTTPTWVDALRSPAGDLPLAVADFANDRYWANASEQLRADVVVLGTGAALDADGVNGGQITLIGGIAASVFGQATRTLRMRTKFISTDPNSESSYLLNSDGANRLRILHQVYYGTAQANVEVYDDIGPDTLDFFADPLSTTTTALTFTPSDYKVSVNGQAVKVGVMGSPEPYQDGTALGIWTNPGSPKVALFAVYAAQPDSDLPALAS